METALFVGAGVLAALLVFALIKKLVKMALVLMFLLFSTGFVWYVVHEEAPPDVRADMDEAAEQLGEKAEQAARAIGRKTGEVVAPAVKEFGNKAKEIGTEAGKAAVGTAKKLGEAAVEEAVEAVKAAEATPEPSPEAAPDAAEATPEAD